MSYDNNAQGDLSHDDDAQDDPCQNDDDAHKIVIVKTAMMLKLWC